TRYGPHELGDAFGLREIRDVTSKPNPLVFDIDAHGPPNSLERWIRCQLLRDCLLDIPVGCEWLEHCPLTRFEIGGDPVRTRGIDPLDRQQAPSSCPAVLHHARGHGPGG